MSVESLALAGIPVLFSQVLLRERIFLRLSLPHDRHDPPALAVVDELKAVYSALERFCVILLATRLIGTEDLRDFSESRNFVGNAAFKEALVFENGEERSM